LETILKVRDVIKIIETDGWYLIKPRMLEVIGNISILMNQDVSPLPVI